MLQQGNRPTTLLKYFFTLVTLSCLLSACFTSDDDESGPDLTWQSGNYHSPGEYFGYCDSASIRFYMRSIFNEVYYWYQDIIDTDPNAFSGLSSYFDYLVSNDLTSSGKEKDAYSTLVDSLIFDLAIGESIEIGYGLRLTYVNDESVATIAFVASSSPASDAGLKRGDRIIAAIAQQNIIAATRLDTVVIGCIKSVSALHNIALRIDPAPVHKAPLLANHIPCRKAVTVASGNLVISL